ncbi:hypothetical protein F5Y19DRAFT_469727 [Xylariaceae sp. FL1651]|nr:hypothetical protein F5Y19DRAFT_469727 [Xylariaceae sp. FL1651]
MSSSSEKISGLSYLAIDKEDVIRTRDLLAQYLKRDELHRFQMEGFLGGGYNGLTWKVKYEPIEPVAASPGSNPWPTGLKTGERRIILKTTRRAAMNSSDHEEDEDEYNNSKSDSEYEDNTQNIIEEKMFVRALQWAKHTVTELRPHKDPLKQTFPGVRPHYMKGEWMYMEWLENGTLKKFVDRALDNGVPIPLPNRLLWRLFMCLIRMCIAMGWPPDMPDGENPQPVSERIQGPPHGGFIHGDLHHENLMFGEMLVNDPDTEHALTPILKMIDFGSMQQKGPTASVHKAAIANNLYDIGVMMIEIITLDYSTEVVPDGSKDKEFRLDNTQNVFFITSGGDLLPNEYGVDPFPSLDKELRDLVCACLAVDEDLRPSLAAVANRVSQALRLKDEQYYVLQGTRGESDEEIRNLVYQLILECVF